MDINGVIDVLTYPQINPIAFSIGPIHVHWYGLMYLVAIFSAWGLALWRVKHYHLKWTTEEVSDLIFYGALGVIIGGRLGYMLFYNTIPFLKAPWSLFKIWEGGMSFHGGLLGVMIACYIFARKIKQPFLYVTDFIAPLIPLGLGAGRIGNFINSELWGRPSDLPWAMIFPNGGPVARHPSQLYELGLEGLLLFVIIWFYANKPRPLGRVSALFLIVYALCRITVEFFREPDVQMGYLAGHWLTMGMVLSLPMLFLGLFVWWYKR